jgi:hypothetical protein
MRYMLMLFSDESVFETFSPEEQEAGVAQYAAWGEEMTKRGVLVGGERLRPTGDATTVRVHDGEVLASDGPFAETKEQMGGYFIIEAKDLDEAIEIASKNPSAHHGTVEVRPIWEM